MKGAKALIDEMNALLEAVLAAQNQNLVHAEICENWGYTKLQMAFKMEVINKMRQSEWLIERIIYLKGTPRVSKLNTVIKLGKTVREMISNEIGEEQATLETFNNAIILAGKKRDQGSIDLLTRILRMEEQHAGWVEAQQTQMKQMGLDNYLNNQTLELVN